MSKIKLALDVVNDLRNLAGSIEGLVEAMKANETEVAKAELEQPKKTKTKKSTESKQESEPEQKQPTLEEVRAAMAEKNREGHREAIKSILIKYGANKLTALDSKHYTEVMKEVGDIK
ncbi:MULTISPECIES: rRNA biogenesis protein rrp5 [Bacillaceae]|uniref:rRNA biogenesis protein rrp5 n=1 Tax=Evansella alkalicola TaxID=745819 RepID=A0ABS6JX01_9BACI|nr:MULTISPECIES: rRNA biogenesis protein rrp5 [Bacillaceae]MBU9723096.1 rRNA biogenesis protein rrp5 [Bacillus alkalicola]